MHQSGGRGTGQMPSSMHPDDFVLTQPHLGLGMVPSMSGVGGGDGYGSHTFSFRSCTQI